MSDTTATKLTRLCTGLAVLGALLGLVMNSGTPTDAAPSVAVAPVTIDQPAAGQPVSRVDPLRSARRSTPG